MNQVDLAVEAVRTTYVEAQNVNAKKKLVIRKARAVGASVRLIAEAAGITTQSVYEVLREPLVAPVVDSPPTSTPSSPSVATSESVRSEVSSQPHKHVWERHAWGSTCVCGARR